MVGLKAWWTFWCEISERSSQREDLWMEFVEIFETDWRWEGDGKHSNVQRRKVASESAMQGCIHTSSLGGYCGDRKLSNASIIALIFGWQVSSTTADHAVYCMVVDSSATTTSWTKLNGVWLRYRLRNIADPWTSLGQITRALPNCVQLQDGWTSAQAGIHGREHGGDQG